MVTAHDHRLDKPKPHRKDGAERRCEPRHPETTPRFEPLWLFCDARAVGGQAMLRDISHHGLGIAVSRRGTWRLVGALREALSNGTPVHVSRIPVDRNREARVVWVSDAGTGQIYFGLKLTEPLTNWPA